ncbi:MAG: hypothetical protein ACKVZ6_19690 [Kineosporiaceae bacterium]
MNPSAPMDAAPTDDRRSRWSRLLDHLAPAPGPGRLVCVAEVGRDSVRFAEECLADVDLHPVLQEVGTMSGTRFRVLVSARDREIAAQVVAGF